MDRNAKRLKERGLDDILNMTDAMGTDAYVDGCLQWAACNFKNRNSYILSYNFLTNNGVGPQRLRRQTGQ